MASNQSRRDFIKIAAGSLGGALVAGSGISCAGFGGGGGGNGGLVKGNDRGTIPNGYTFYRVFTPGQLGQYFGGVQTLMGPVMMTDNTIMFWATDSQGRNGVYSMQLSYNGANAPTVVDGSLFVQQGQVWFGKTIARIRSAAINNLAIPSFATVFDAEGSTPMAMVNHSGEGFEVLASHGKTIPNNGRFGASLGDIAINDSNDVLIVADYTQMATGNATAKQALFYMHGPYYRTVDRLVQQGDTIGYTRISRFGIVDLDNLKNSAYQVFSTIGDSGSPSPGALAGVMAANAGDVPRLVAGPPGMGRTRDAMVGNAFLGPRVQNGTLSTATQFSGGRVQLSLDTDIISGSGSPSPSGKQVLSVGPACVSESSLAYFVAMVSDGMELQISDGITNKVLLTTGSPLPGDSTNLVAIVHGYHPDQADTQGRVVFVGEFADQSQSIVIGVPT